MMAMMPADQSSIVEALSGSVLLGCVSTTLGPGGLALVFDDGRALLIQRSWLLSEDETAEAVSMTVKRLSRQGSELYTVAALLDTMEDAASDARSEADRLRKEEEIRGLSERRRSVGRIGEEPPVFGDGMDIIGTGATSQEARARTEALARETPDV